MEGCEYGYYRAAKRNVLLRWTVKLNCNCTSLHDLCEKVVEQFGLGIADFMAVGAIVSGRNNLATRGKIGGNTTKGTSYASKASRAIFKKTKFPFGIELPTWLGGYTPWTARKVWVRNIGTFVGRTVPLLGVVMLTADLSQILYNTLRDYNVVAREEDKLW